MTDTIEYTTLRQKKLEVALRKATPLFGREFSIIDFDPKFSGERADLLEKGVFLVSPGQRAVLTTLVKWNEHERMQSLSKFGLMDIGKAIGFNDDASRNIASGLEQGNVINRLAKAIGFEYISNDPKYQPHRLYIEHVLRSEATHPLPGGMKVVATSRPRPEYGSAFQPYSAFLITRPDLPKMNSMLNELLCADETVTDSVVNQAIVNAGYSRTQSTSTRRMYEHKGILREIEFLRQHRHDNKILTRQQINLITELNRLNLPSGNVFYLAWETFSDPRSFVDEVAMPLIDLGLIEKNQRYCLVLTDEGKHYIRSVRTRKKKEFIRAQEKSKADELTLEEHCLDVGSIKLFGKDSDLETLFN
ncbi:hypothetical protein HOD83_03040 [Candidatus Woesearchaeota archaeon]|jgi:hypothetical protein|nr:hypothetical protein [Candidatus Woesearchaeota archaeon]MBT4248534.1 hypothetical protein [Candidatus Woesearchaeota archaeon]